MALPIYTHIPNLKGLTKIFLSYLIQKVVSRQETSNKQKKANTNGENKPI